MSSPVPAKKSRLLRSTLRPGIVTEEFINTVKAAWNSAITECSEFKDNDVEIISYPFPVCFVNNFIDSPDLLKLVIEEVKNVEFHQKSNDLYEFKQSEDVKNLNDFTFITQLYELIRTEGLNWVRKAFDIKLKDDISATFSSYKYHDRLLCHDDKCEDRHIAFVLYLVEDWKREDGGALELFDTDANNYPSEVIKTVIPQFNTIVFFEVTHQSFHQVSEVLSPSKERLSLNGWFHSPCRKLSEFNWDVLEYEQSYGNATDFYFREYILFTYLDNMNKSDIRTMFLSESEIQLQEFLVPTFLEEINRDLKSNAIKWICKGPANMRKYDVAEPSSLPPSLQVLKEIFESRSWFGYLKSLTGLDFVPSEKSNLEIWERGSLPCCSFEIQMWTPSCYTLIHDQDMEFHNSALDVILRIPFDEGDDGDVSNENDDVPEPGHIIYIDSDSKDEECLLQIGYKMNSLALIYRDLKTLRYTKYMDSTTKPFFQLFGSYQPWRPPPEEPNLKHCDGDSESESSVVTIENTSDTEILWN